MRADLGGPKNHVLGGVEIPIAVWQFGGCPTHSEALAVFAAMCAAKGINSIYIGQAEA